MFENFHNKVLGTKVFVATVLSKMTLGWASIYIKNKTTAFCVCAYKDYNIPREFFLIM